MSDSERSGIHRQVERWLSQMNISFESEVSFPPYQVDIYLPEWHLAIEVDGPYHLSKHDQKRDRELVSNYQLITHRISQKNFRAEHVRSSIKMFIENNADSAPARKQEWLTVR